MRNLFIAFTLLFSTQLLTASGLDLSKFEDPMFYKTVAVIETEKDGDMELGIVYYAYIDQLSGAADACEVVLYNPYRTGNENIVDVQYWFESTYQEKDSQGIDICQEKANELAERLAGGKTGEYHYDLGSYDRSELKGLGQQQQKQGMM